MFYKLDYVNWTDWTGALSFLMKPSRSPPSNNLYSTIRFWDWSVAEVCFQWSNFKIISSVFFQAAMCVRWCLEMRRKPWLYKRKLLSQNKHCRPTVRWEKNQMMGMCLRLLVEPYPNRPREGIEVHFKKVDILSRSNINI